jgi:hypothetical protein
MYITVHLELFLTEVVPEYTEAERKQIQYQITESQYIFDQLKSILHSEQTEKSTKQQQTQSAGGGEPISNQSNAITSNTLQPNVETIENGNVTTETATTTTTAAAVVDKDDQMIQDVVDEGIEKVIQELSYKS